MRPHFIFSRRNNAYQFVGHLPTLLALGVLLAPIITRAESAGGTYVEQIQNQRFFGPPLLWVGEQKPEDAEYQALLADIDLFKTDGIKAGINGLEGYLQKYPQSGWVPALNINLAEYYRSHGRYSLALSHWETAWNATKDGKDATAQYLAVRSIAGWTRLLASLGEKDKLSALFTQLDDRQLPLGLYGTEIQETKEGLIVMKSRPRHSYRCGSFALGHMAEALHLDAQLCRRLYEMDSPDGGFHMDQLLTLAQTNGIEVEAVRRPPGAELVVPCVVHWKLNHYAAILQEKNGRYLVTDPTFGGQIWMDADTIDAEASGEFILPKDKVPASWHQLTQTESAAIYGKGYPNLFNDSDDDSPDPCDQDDEDENCDPPAANDGAGGGGGSGCCTGMPRWTVSEPYCTLWLEDVPLLYRQSNGKWMQLKLTYKSTGEWLGWYGDPNSSRFQGFGPDWSCNWMGVLATGEEPSTTITNHLAGGGIVGFDTGGAPDYKTGRKLVFTGATCTGYGGPVMALQTPTGSQNVYGQSLLISSPITNYFLTERLDRYGRVLEQMNYPGILEVVDMDGQTNMLWGSLINAVTNPYAYTAHFTYSSSLGLGAHWPLLTNIVDAQGLSSSFMYDSSHHITNMITPYGTNSFQYFSGSASNGYLMRSLLVTEPTGDHQLYVYRDYDPGDGTPYPSDGAGDERLTFHWNRSQYLGISAGGKANVVAMTTNDYLLASVKHWLRDPTATYVTDTMDSMADPYDPNLGTRPNCISFQYYGQGPGSHQVGSLKRVTSVSVNGQLAMTIGRNSLGRPTNFVNYSSYSTLASYTNFFDPSGEILRSELGPRSEHTRGYGYDPVITNLLTSVTNAAGDVIRYTHNTNTMKVTSITFPGGMVRTNVYYNDGTPHQGFLAMQADLGFRTNYFDYTNGNLCVQTNELGLVTTYTYDNLNRLTSTTYPDGTTTSNVYNNLDIVATEDRLGQWTYYSYNSLRQLVAVTNVNGQVTTYDYCGCGQPATITRYNGATALTTTFYYDIIGRLTNAIYPDLYQLSYAYDTNDRVRAVTDGGGHELDLSYALIGLESKITNAMLGGQTLLTQQFDEYGRVTNSLDRNQVKTALGYDFLDRLVARQNFGADGKQSGPESFVYNALGLTNYTDPLSHLTTFVRDAAGRVLYETNGNKEVLQFTYNPSDELLTLTDGKNQTTAWNYDEYGRVTNKIDAASITNFVYQYDPNDRLTNRWSAAMGTTVYRYDPIGNLTNVDYSGGTVSTPSIYFAYDGVNRLVTMLDGIGTTTFGWTGGDQLASETGPWVNDTVSYTYLNRLRASLTLLQPNASPWTQGYGYDSVMRLSTVTSPAGSTSITSPSGTFTYTYSGGGDRVLGLQLPGFPSGSSLYITNRYDSLARLTNTFLNSPLLGVIDVHQYSYDPGSQVTQQVFSAGNFTAYTYDNIGQLKSAKGMESGGSLSRLHEQFGYGYDAAWNLNYRTNNALIQSFSVNNLNELSSASRNGTLTVAGTTTEPGADVTGVTVSGTGLSSGAATEYADGTWARTNATPANGLNTYTAIAHDTYGRGGTNTVTVNLPASPTYGYDLNGNLTNDGTRNFAYDDENQLTAVWVANTWSNSFAYDGLLRKRIERDYSWNGSSWLETNEVRYVYDGNLVFQERDQNNLPVTTYTRGVDLSGTLQGAGGIGGLLARSDRLSVIPLILSPIDPQPQNVVSSYYHSDGNGNVTVLVEPNGLTVASYEYDPFGNIISMSGPLAGANKYRFSSKEWNDNTATYYYGYRFYDPNLQRWLNRDPLSNIGRLVRFGSFMQSEINVGRNIASFESWGGANLYCFVDNDPADEYDPVGELPPSSPVCKALQQKIANIEKEIQKRTRELYEDPMGLPGSAPGDDKKPSLSRRGHQKILNMMKANLAAKKAIYQANCSDPEPPPESSRAFRISPILPGPTTPMGMAMGLGGAAALAGGAAAAPATIGIGIGAVAAP